MDAFKRFYSNAPKDDAGNRDYAAVMPEFWESVFDKEGFSIWICTYNYNDENTIGFMTSNLVGGFVQRSDALRRHAFGIMHILNNEKPFEVTGCWMLRGQSIQPMLDSNPDAEYYSWTKIDPGNEEDRKRVEEYWTAEEKLMGKDIFDGKIFK